LCYTFIRSRVIWLSLFSRVMETHQANVSSPKDV
jgi:hypothetical protein